MRELLIKVLVFLFAARAKVRPYPGWNFGSWKLETGVLPRLRRKLWNRMEIPCRMRWWNGLHIYIYPDEEISRSLFFLGCYEPNQFAFLDKILEPGMAFIDLGANMGLYSLFAAKKVGRQGTVLAIEPSTREFQRLKTHVKLNTLPNICLLQVAVSNRQTEADLLIATEKNTGHNTLGMFGYDSVQLQEKEKVHVEKLDDLIQERSLKRLDVIKMDIEGTEFFALQGAINTLTQFHPVILLELSDITLEHQGCHSKQVWDFLTQLGYTFYSFDDKGLPVLAQYKSYFGAVNVVAVPDFQVAL